MLRRGHGLCLIIFRVPHSAFRWRGSTNDGGQAGWVTVGTLPVRDQTAIESFGSHSSTSSRWMKVTFSAVRGSSQPRKNIWDNAHRGHGPMMDR